MSGEGQTQDNARSLHDESKRYYMPHEVIKGYALEVAQLLFKEPDNPFGLVWDPDVAKSDLVIVDKYSFNLDQVDTVAIVANRGPQAWTKSSGFRQLQHVDMRTDTRTYTDLVRGSAVLSCFSRQGMEAERIAGFLFEGFQTLRDVLRKIARRGIMVPNHLGFFRIEATTMGEEALIKSDSRPELSVVPVAITASVQRRYSVRERNQRKLANITIGTSISGS